MQSPSAEPLVGRSAELAALDATLATARRTFAAAEIVGEPGIGKTRLLAELAAHADAQGCLVLTGSASELEADLPFGVFVDALDEYLRGLEPRRLDGLDDATRAELVHVFPALPRGGPASDERYRLHRAVRALLEELARPKPLVLVLDDLHWADSGSLELLGSLLRRPPIAPVLLALAVRPRQLPERLAGALERAGSLTRIDLGQLSAAEARELVGERADAVYASSGGNPFYLQQLARAPQRSEAVGPAVALAGVEVPRAVAAALAGELAQLSGDARQVLAGAAVAGDPFEPELAAAAAGVSEELAMAALDDLLRGDLVRATDVPRRFRFRHPLVRGAVYESAPGGWRLLAHERSAQALAERGATALERAHHVERSARRGDAGACAVLTEAAATAATRAPATAARLSAAALRLLGPAAPERPGLLAAQARAHMAAGQWRSAYDSIRECASLAPAPEVPIVATAAALEHMLGRHQDAHTRLQAALAGLPDDSSPAAARLMLEIGRDGLYRMDYPSMLEWARRALAAARPLGDRPLTAATASGLALAGAFAGAIGEAEAAIDEAAAIADSLSDDELARNLDFPVNALAAAEVLVDRLDAGGARAERGLALAQATGQGQVLPILFWTATIRTMRGRLREAAELFDTSIEIARVAGHDQGMVWNLFGRSFTATAAGDTATALTTAREAAGVMNRLERSFPATGAGHALAAALLAGDDAAGALAALLAAGDGEALPDLPAAWRPGALELLTRCLLALGRHDDASRAARRAQQCAAALGLRSAGAMADRAAAAVTLDGAGTANTMARSAGDAAAAATLDGAGTANAAAHSAGDAAAAATLALRSAAALGEIGAPVEAALSRALAGRAFAAAGDADQAAAELARAAEAFERCEAFGHRDACERELRRLGRRGRYRRTRAAGDGSLVGTLTERELQIARLVVDRQTNAQIAAELYLSTKTIETHLRNLFHKLGVSSRVEVARAVESADRDSLKTA